MKRIRTNNYDYYGKNIKGTIYEKILLILFWVFIPIPFILGYYLDIEYIEYISASILGLIYFGILFILISKVSEKKNKFITSHAPGLLNIVIG